MKKRVYNVCIATNIPCLDKECSGWLFGHREGRTKPIKFFCCKCEKEWGYEITKQVKGGDVRVIGKDLRERRRAIKLVFQEEVNDGIRR